MADNINAEMTWDPQADIQMKGYEWQEISNFLQIFQGAMVAFNAITSRNIANKTITIKYVYNDGKEVPAEEVAKLQVKRMEDYSKQIKEAQLTPSEK